MVLQVEHYKTKKPNISFGLSHVSLLISYFKKDAHPSPLHSLFLSNRMDAFRETFQALQHSSIENLLAKGEYINPHGKAEVISRSLLGEI